MSVSSLSLNLLCTDLFTRLHSAVSFAFNINAFSSIHKQTSAQSDLLYLLYCRIHNQNREINTTDTTIPNRMFVLED